MLDDNFSIVTLKSLGKEFIKSFKVLDNLNNYQNIKNILSYKNININKDINLLLNEDIKNKMKYLMNKLSENIVQIYLKYNINKENKTIKY